MSVGSLFGDSRYITMKPRGFTARFTCRALSTARQGLFYAFTFSPFSTLFKQRQKQGGPPLYVERSEMQQLFCPVFSLLRMAGEWGSSSISRGVENTVTLLFCFKLFITGLKILSQTINKIQDNKVVALPTSLRREGDRPVFAVV